MSADAEKRLEELEQGSSSSDAWAFYDSLPAASLEQMIGAWRGSGVPTGHVFDGMLEEFGWHGKRFETTEIAHPLVFEKPDGSLFYLNPARLPMGMVLDHVDLARSSASASFFRLSSGMLATKDPQARLRMIEYRGVVTASMVYDALPIIDVFRAVGPDTLIGAMDMRGFEQPFLFALRREASPAPLDA
ncbi:DUF4334 domain-containing protein [Tropicimonas isoalkanivorans]|uniref:GXWXG protein n=1 Tax=Tropicimonas isoalkanivorans TaxID=441112 RepID=A0A1I1DWS7_9RHOB|nr:DUF4334 domain-containing protein [Tropicimonas isoalkanivorans]SFB77478.1 GXWXG protein [Tropicimonas isoalkanivorans]